jgi:Fur family transcriptional regulator, ferric uptake regulator
VSARAADARVSIPHRLASRGFRLTGPRKAVLEVLFDLSAPLSVAEIHARVKRRRVNVASVYRAVQLLCDLGVLSTADTSNGVARYELSEEFTGHHHHLICRECGRIEDLDGCLLTHGVLAAVNRRVQRSRNFRVTGHDLRLYGICGPCADTPKPAP